jgi:surfactin synthase thioesterase subunit
VSADPAALIDKTEGDAWIRRFHPSPDAPLRLLCLPHAGGSASYFFRTSRELAPVAEVLTVQYPGRQDRRAEGCIEDIAVLADHVAEAVRLWTDRPLALFGHSMGATLAFEVASRLRRSGVPSAGLFVSGRRAPSTYRDETIHQRSDSGLIDELRALSGTNTELLSDEDFVRVILPPLRSDYRAIERYQWHPDEPLACPIFALVGDNDPRTTEAEAEAWRSHTNGVFELHVFPGGHFYLNEHMAGVVSLIKDRLSVTEPGGHRAGLRRRRSGEHPRHMNCEYLRQGWSR